MGCKLIINNQVEVATNPAVVGDVHVFTGGPVLVGSAAACQCRVAAPELAPQLFVLEQPQPEQNRWSVRPLPQVEVFVNDQTLSAATELHSGDQIRVGHWTFAFHRDYALSAAIRRSDWSARVAQVLLAVLLLVEIALVAWLPRHLHRARLWENQMVRQRTLLHLDQLRNQISGSATEPLRIAAVDLLSQELNALAGYVRKHQDNLQVEQWRQLEDQLQQFQTILTQLEQQGIFPAVPAVNLDAGVSSLLR